MRIDRAGAISRSASTGRILPAPTEEVSVEELRRILREYWGYGEFRPLQAEAMRAVIDGRDSVVILPTGGGKSLCFQAPALQLPGLAVVVSPLISLMKDQVDALADCGVPAACVNSSLSYEEKRGVAAEIRAGRLKLLYLSPERLMMERTLEFLQEIPALVLRDRRGPLHQRMGTRFPPRISDVAAPQGKILQRRHPRLYGNRHSPRARAISRMSCISRIRKSWSARSIGRTSSTGCSGGRNCSARCAR